MLRLMFGGIAHANVKFEKEIIFISQNELENCCLRAIRALADLLHW